MKSFQSLWIWSALVVPSLGTLVKYLSWPGAVIYSAGVWLLLGQAHRLLRIPPRAARWLIGGTAALVVGAFLVCHPLVDAQVAGKGSDDDEAHDLGVAALLRGESPYEQRTYLNNQLHQMPGAFLLAAPFAIVGTSALQNLFWLTAFFAVVAKETRDPRLVLALLWIILLGSAEVSAHLITGTGYSANAISVLLGLHWLTRRPRSSLAAAFWGITLASRANFLLLLPVAFGWLRQTSGWSSASRAIVTTAGVLTILALPFFLADPQQFGPLTAPLDRVFRFDEVIANTGIILLAAAVILAVTLAIRPMTYPGLLRRCAIVLAFPAAAGTILASLQQGAISFDYLSYGLFASWFVFLADPLSTSAVARPRFHLRASRFGGTGRRDRLV